MSEEMSFRLKRASNIQGLMDAFRARFQKELRGRIVTKYVFVPGRKYLLTLSKGDLAQSPAAAILLQVSGDSWRAVVSLERSWGEEVSFSKAQESFLADVKRFFLEESGDLITIIEPWASGHAKEERDELEGDYVKPFYSELSAEGTLARCPNCGAAEIIFPDRRTCSECGTEIVKADSFMGLDEPEGEGDVYAATSPVSAPDVGKCMVCHMNIHRGEPLLCCPNCACKAHRTHFLEYLHVKGECPSCHVRITGAELSKGASPKRGPRRLKSA